MLLVHGGFALMPQCCSTIASVHSWCDLYRQRAGSGYISEGHPAPTWTFTDAGANIVFQYDPDENFAPPTGPSSFIIQTTDLLAAIPAAVSEVMLLASRLERFRDVCNLSDAAKVLVWSDENGRDGVARL